MTEQKNARALHMALWGVQVLLALAFGMAGFMKMTAPIEQLAQMGMTFVNRLDVGTVRFIGISEMLGAIGLILPAALRIKPMLTPLAALGIAVIMVLAIFQHVSNNEPYLPNIFLLALAVFVAWGRFIKAPIQAK